MKDFSEIRQSDEVLEEGLQDPPIIVVLRRTAIRTFPGNQRVALYTNDRLGIEVSLPYQHGNLGGQKLIGTMRESVEHEAHAVQKLGEYLHALKSGNAAHSVNIRNDFAKRHGERAADHMHLTATFYHRGEYAKADHHWKKMIDHLGQPIKESIQEGAIHKLHSIAKTGADGDVVFKNGAQSRVSGKQALAILKLHKALSPENKVKLETQVNGSPEELKKAIEFANDNLK